MSLPIIFYGLFLYFSDALSLAIGQLFTQTDLIDTAILRYLTEMGFYLGLIGGFAGALLLTGQVKIRWTSDLISTMIGNFIIINILLASAVALFFGRFFGAPSFALFGAVLGTTIAILLPQKREPNYVMAGGFVLLFAWTTSISVGANTPALASGPLLLFLVYFLKKTAQSYHSRWMSKPLSVLIVALMIIILFCFSGVRYYHIYRELPANKLTYSLEGILPAGKNIRTNKNTYDLLLDLNTIISGSESAQYCIMPDIAAYWINAPIHNPIPIDWATRGELFHHVDRVIDSLDSHRKSNIVIIQKVVAKKIATKMVRLEAGEKYPAIEHVRQHYKKIDETQFFEIYK